MNLKIFCDGGARGNPGPAAWAFIAYNEKNEVITQKNEKIGETTNNVAEYTAVVKALEWLKTLTGTHLITANFYIDSQLVVFQLNGLFKVKSAHLRELLLQAKAAEIDAKGEINYHYIPREKNFQADALVNQALDAD
ncbi:ribonuclease HI family protein [Candidatus Microgenomates bacterium]|nr:ribonuclease HI family protein [Candidatus Microgenomates bacterium]